MAVCSTVTMPPLIGSVTFSSPRTAMKRAWSGAHVNAHQKASMLATHAALPPSSSNPV